MPPFVQRPTAQRRLHCQALSISHLGEQTFGLSLTLLHIRAQSRIFLQLLRRQAVWRMGTDKAARYSPASAAISIIFSQSAAKARLCARARR
jgi:hypothetical protein